MIRSIIILAFLLRSMSVLPAQSPNYVNVHNSLGYLATVFTGIYPTDSCVYLKGVMTDSLFRAGSFFSKVSLNGDFIWTKELVDSTKIINTWFTDIIQNKQGNFIIAGNYHDYVDEPSTACYVAEYSPEGNLVNYNKFPSPYYPGNAFVTPLDIIALEEAGYVLVGNLGIIGNKETFIARLDDSLQLQWLKPFGWSLREGSRSVLRDEDGGFIVAGWEFANADGGNSNIVSRKMIVKLDSLGENEAWVWKYPEPLLPPLRGYSVNDILLLPDGSIVGASAVSYEQFSAGGSSLLTYPTMFKLAPDHSTLAWETRFGPNYFSRGWHEMRYIEPANDGGGYVGLGMLSLHDSTSSGYAIVLGTLSKVAENGDSLWMQYLYFLPGPGDREHLAHAMKPAADGNGYWICGEVKSPYQKGWLLRVDNYGCMAPGCQLSPASEALEDKISLYPNPASDFMVLQHNGYAFSKGRFRLVNTKGQIVQDWASPMDDLQTVFDLQAYEAGAYFLQYVEQGVVLAVKKLIVTHP